MTAGDRRAAPCRWCGRAARRLAHARGAARDRQDASRRPRRTTTRRRSAAEKSRQRRARGRRRRAGRHRGRASQAMSGGGGRRCRPSLRSTFEPRFGYDFGTSGCTPAARPRARRPRSGARAFTVGDHIFFGAGRVPAVERRRPAPHRPRADAHDPAEAARLRAPRRACCPGRRAQARAAALRGRQGRDPQQGARTGSTRDFPPWDLITLIIGWDPIDGEAGEGLDARLDPTPR